MREDETLGRGRDERLIMCLREGEKLRINKREDDGGYGTGF